MPQAYSPTIFPVVPSTMLVDGCHPFVVDSVKSYKMKKELRNIEKINDDFYFESIYLKSIKQG